MLDFNPLATSLPQALASALRRLAHLAHTTSWDQWAAQRLTPTQRRILDVVASRRESLTLSALARELGVTPATASDSVGALESKGLVQKRRSEVDGRALALMLTSEGKSSVTALAARPDPLQDAFGALTASEQEMFYRSAIKMIRGLQESGALPVSRMCLRCRHFEPFRAPGTEYPHHCHMAGSALADRHLRLECQEYEAGDDQEQNAVWEKFAAARPPGEDVSPSQVES
jgi:DNA-binding MarR family transcriptional regulator